ncbi:MAG: hypothetical protein D6816_13975 [Bacteroidetes bacterium]|nr:MAG: hypothetical protein D6816_13975 [Bacteroidota bacterium]
MSKSRPTSYYLQIAFYSLLFGLIVTGLSSLDELLEPGYWEDEPGTKYVRMILLMSMVGLSFQLKDGPKSPFWPPKFKRGSGDFLVISFLCLFFGLCATGAGVVLTRIVFPAVSWESNWFLLPLILAAALWYYFQAEKRTD